MWSSLSFSMSKIKTSRNGQKYEDYNVPFFKKKMLAHDLPICFLSAFKATDDEDDATTT